MIYYSNNGAYPVTAAQLPEQAISPNGMIWTHLDDNEIGREQCGYIEVGSPPEYDPATQKLGWDGSQWTLEPVDPPADPPPVVVEISHKDFLDLLTHDERTRLTAARKKLAAQTDTEFLASDNVLYQYLSDMLEQFDKSAAIQLTDPTTQFGITHVLLPLGIFDGGDPDTPGTPTDAQTARAQALLSNTKPS